MMREDEGDEGVDGVGQDEYCNITVLRWAIIHLFSANRKVRFGMVAPIVGSPASVVLDRGDGLYTHRESCNHKGGYSC